MKYRSICVAGILLLCSFALTAGFDSPPEEGRRLVRIDHDPKCDGSVAWSIRYQYDSKGNRTREIFDSGTDGGPGEITFFDYDPRGLLMKKEKRRKTGGVKERISYTYNRSGKKAHEKHEACALPGDPGNRCRPLSCTTYDYDAAGRLVKKVADHQCEGRKKDCTDYKYDEKGNRIEESRDLDCNGTVNFSETYGYDGKNNRIWYKKRYPLCIYFGTGCLEGREEILDGTDWIVTVYDADGRKQRSFQTRDGVAPAGYCTTWSYDEKGRPGEKTVSVRCNDRIDSKKTYENGQVKTEYVWGGDDKLQWCKRYKYGD